MAVTPNYGWVMPDSTDYVKDLPADFATFGNAVDASLYTVASTSLSASIVDAKGDLLVGSAPDTLARLAVGTNGQYLIANSATASGVAWSTLSIPADNWQLIASATLSASNGFSFTSLSGYKKLMLLAPNFFASTTGVTGFLRLNADSGSNYYSSALKTVTGTRGSAGATSEIVSNFTIGQTSNDRSSLVLMIDGCNGGGYKPYEFHSTGLDGGTQTAQVGSGIYFSTSHISSINFTLSTGTISSGSPVPNNISLWGVA